MAAKGGRGGGHSQGATPSVVVCQRCGKDGHTVLQCYKRFDASFTSPPQKSASSTTTSYGGDTNRYMDSGDTDHNTSELEKLIVHDKYSCEQVHAANGLGMEKNHVGHSILRSLASNIHLNNILHVPKASKNLLSVNCLT